MSKTEIIHAYRHLYREVLRAVRYATPARYTARDQLRRAFREPREFNSHEVERTGWFLSAAAKEAGMEHKILKNLLSVAWYRDQDSKMLWRGRAGGVEAQNRMSIKDLKKKEQMYRHYDMTIDMLNKTLGFRLR